jgi:hypothetical protein
MEYIMIEAEIKIKAKNIESLHKAISEIYNEIKKVDSYTKETYNQKRR